MSSRSDSIACSDHVDYRRIVEDSNDISYLADSNGVLTYISPQAEEYGFLIDDFIGRTILDIVAPEDKGRVAADFEHSMETGEEFPTEFRIQAPSGDLHWFEERGSLIRDDSGSVTGIVGVIRHITERKLIEEQVMESENRYRQVFESIPDAALELYGYTRDEFLLLSHPDISAEHAKSLISYRDTIYGRLDRIPVRYHRRKDGSTFPAEISACSFTLYGQRVLCGIAKDISQRLEEEHKLEEESQCACREVRKWEKECEPRSSALSCPDAPRHSWKDQRRERYAARPCRRVERCTADSSGYWRVADPVLLPSCI
jgi:PAS domain S-box-containing protein